MMKEGKEVVYVHNVSGIPGGYDWLKTGIYLKNSLQITFSNDQ